MVCGLPRARKGAGDGQAKATLCGVQGAGGAGGGQGQKTVHEIAREYEVHPVQVQVSQWKKDLVKRLPGVFWRKPDPEAEILVRQKERLERNMGLKSVCPRRRWSVPHNGSERLTYLAPWRLCVPTRRGARTSHTFRCAAGSWT